MSNTCLIITLIVIVLGMSTTRTNENKRQLQVETGSKNNSRAPRNDVNTNVLLHLTLKGNYCYSNIQKIF